MDKEFLKNIFTQFDTNTDFSDVYEFTSGHINDTFLVETTSDKKFVLQRINHLVFKDVPGLMANKVNISKHLLKKLSHLSEDELKRRVLIFVPLKEREIYYYQDLTDNYWNLMVYVNDSVTYETVTSEEVAYEGGKLIGDFLNLTSDFDATQLTEIIPKFHNIHFRFSQFENALKDATESRIKNAEVYIKKVQELKEEMLIIQKLKDSGEIKLRVTHNDTKISNVLFDENQKGLCVIDTDTIMPGIVHYDFGDAIRTICNTAVEDEVDLNKVTFNLPFYKAYVKGFMEMTRSSLTPLEIKHLPLSAKTMIFIIGLRFLNDYLNGDIYFKTNYLEHNLNRAKNQFKLLDSLTEQWNEMQVN